MAAYALNGPTKVLLPRMSDHALVVAGVMRGMGIEARVLPAPDDESMAVGRSLCRGRECLPCFLCTGDILKKCREADFDVDDHLFFMPRGPGPCRFGQYSVLQKQILAEEGFPNANLFSPTTEDSYALFGDDPLTLRKRAWQAIVTTDLVTKATNEHRPYEVVPGSADQVHRDCIDRLVRAAEEGAGSHFVEAMAWCAGRFAGLEVERSNPRPLILVIGEIYLMLNETANLRIVRAVEATGGEVLQGTFMDWLHFVDWRRVDLGLRFRDYADVLKATLSDQYQRRWQRKLLRPIRSLFRHPPDSSVSQAVRHLVPHYEPVLGTEAVLTMARTLATYHHGLAGIINVLPFSCMPGTIVAAMAPQLRQQMDGVPWLDLSFDGQGETNVNTRLEAFMHQALQFQRRVVEPGRRGPVGSAGSPAGGPEAEFEVRSTAT